MYPLQALEADTKEADMIFDKCDLARTPPIHVFLWGDPARPDQREPDDDAVCQCGATTYGLEARKHGVHAGAHVVDTAAAGPNA